ncbi:MAG: cytochrome c oxidase assembly protein [Burkholderiales bacterium]|jgi:cytochrome c oxidase assembly protein subunit 11|nr:cytochrome c oxidase assembly protein [Burkholderiales bacterium]
MTAPTDGTRLKLHTLGKLALLVALMFGFGFAMVPLYRAICEVTGINSLTKIDPAVRELVRNTQVDTSRTVTIELDANHFGAWQFRPEKRSVQAHPGELITVSYELVNSTSKDLSGQAIPSYAPAVSAQYMHKLECFCFRQQTLAAGQTRSFPVVFVIDPRLPPDVSTITLSYTFFDVGAGAAPQSRAVGLTGGV